MLAKKVQNNSWDLGKKLLFPTLVTRTQDGEGRKVLREVFIDLL